MAQKTTTITVGAAELEAVEHALSSAQVRSIDAVGHTDDTLTKVQKKIGAAKAKAAVKAAPKDDEDADADAAG